LRWANNQIKNRWLRITIRATANTGLNQDQVYYVGHLQGEFDGVISDSKYTVLIADLLGVRAAISQQVSASSVADIDKSGVVLVADILSARSNLAAQLTNITIP
jgi:hypothetical protein